MSNKIKLRKVDAILIKADQVASAPPKPSTLNKDTDSEAGRGQIWMDWLDDEFTYLGDIIEPEYKPRSLIKRVEESDILPQCIQAMEVNVDGFGYIIKRNIEGKEAEQRKEEIEREYNFLDAFLRNINDFESLVKIRRKTRYDMEATGNGYWEIMRDIKGQIRRIAYVPSVSMRICKQDKEYVERTVKVINNYEVTEEKVIRKFRKYVQVKGTKKVYFKEFGDPRKMSAKTGKYGVNIPEEEMATEILHFPLRPSADQPYGVPRWIGQIPEIIGSRKASEGNLAMLENSCIPWLIYHVSGGQFTEEAIRAIEEFSRENLRGAKNLGRALILSAQPFTSDVNLPEEKVASCRIDVTPLSQYVKEDALFRGYRKDISDKILSAFRLPPVYVGASQDYTRATAEAARRLAEEQVFTPERQEFDYIINKLILEQELGIKYHRFESKGPDMMDIEIERTTALQSLAPGLTRNELRECAGELLNRKLAKLPYAWAEIPADVFTVLGGFVPQSIPEAAGLDKTAEITAQNLIEALEKLEEKLS